MGLLGRVAKAVVGEKPTVGGLLSRVGVGRGAAGGAAWLMSPEEERVMSPPAV